MNIGYVCYYRQDYEHFRKANEKTHHVYWIREERDFVGRTIDLIIRGDGREDSLMPILHFVDTWETFRGQQPRKQDSSWKIATQDDVSVLRAFLSPPPIHINQRRINIPKITDQEDDTP